MPDTHVEQRYASTSRLNNLMQLAEHGQSCWLDDLSRRMIRDGELADLVDEGVRGVTANPATFAKAIIGGREYDADIANAAASGLDAAKLLARAQDPDVKAKLIENTQSAVERGAFGSPTFFVGKEMFFGKEQLREVEEMVAGG